MMRWILIGLLSAVSCAKQSPLSTDSFVELQTHHATADSLLAKHDISGARAELIAAWEVPLAGTDEEDMRALRQDIAYRLATLELAEDPSKALDWCNNGLALGRDKSIMTANLLMVRGHISHKTGDRETSIADLHEALLINEQLLDKVMTP
jgi:hypothetical protein